MNVMVKECLIDVNMWMNQNRLKMNNAKTEYIQYGSKKQLAKCSVLNLNVNGAIVE